MRVPSLGPAGAYHTRLLEPPDLRDLQALFERARDYFELATGAPPARDEAARAFVAGPPTKQVTDKRVIGVFTSERALVGVLDAVTDWPEPGTWTMGGLVLDPPHRGRGLGGGVLEAYEAWSAAHGAARFRTALVAHHRRGIRFLQRHGYTQASTVDARDATAGNPTVIILVKTRAEQRSQSAPTG